MVRLIVEEQGARRAFRLGEGTLKVGSGAAAQLRLQSGDVADVHAEIDWKDGVARLRTYELPVGVITNIFGAAFFFYLLATRDISADDSRWRRDRSTRPAGPGGPYVPPSLRLAEPARMSSRILPNSRASTDVSEPRSSSGKCVRLS